MTNAVLQLNEFCNNISLNVFDFHAYTETKYLCYTHANLINEELTPFRKKTQNAKCEHHELIKMGNIGDYKKVWKQ